jgi:tRNA 5-methylaminomethyl-2-thiouridine biosynthesis bifunctional protein
VLDAASVPASGASGLPVGLYAPYVSADNNFTSQITDIGVEFTQQLAKRLLIEGVDWQPSGLMTRKYGEAEQWFANAGWIKPAALVQACLNQVGVTWRGNCDVQSLSQNGESWQVIGKDNQVLAESDIVVVATSNHSANLLSSVSSSVAFTPKVPKLSLQAIRGQVTFGHLQDLHPSSRSNFPINGNGSYIETNDAWLVAASYDRVNLSLDANITDQVENFDRLDSLVPEIAAQLKPSFTKGAVSNWVGIRCASSDRLPIVGEIARGLWVLTALASRGLTFAPLCAELLATQMMGEELPLKPRLVKALSVQRYIK